MKTVPEIREQRKKAAGFLEDMWLESNLSSHRANVPRLQARPKVSHRSGPAFPCQCGTTLDTSPPTAKTPPSILRNLCILYNTSTLFNLLHNSQPRHTRPCLSACGG